MKTTFTRILTIFLLLTSTLLQAQPSWQWGKRGGSGGSESSQVYEHIIDMATDSKGNVYVLAQNAMGLVNVDGHAGIGIHDRLSLASWDCEGNFRWMKTFGGGAAFSARALQADTIGGIYVVGNMVNTPTTAGMAYFDTDTVLAYTNRSIYLVKYDTMGNYQWLRMPQPDTVAVAVFKRSQIFDIAAAGNGDVYLYSYLTPANYEGSSFIVNTRGYYVLKYNAAGTYQGITDIDMATTPGSDPTNDDSYNASLAHFSRDNRNGRFYLAGYYMRDFGTLNFGNTTINSAGGVTGYPMYVAAFNNTGSNLWAKQSSPDKSGSIFYRPALDEHGNIYIGGGSQPGNTFNGYTFTNNLSSGVMPFIIAVDSNGANRWATNGNTTAAFAVSAITYRNNTVAVDGSYGQLITWDSLQATAPYFIGTPPLYIFLARFNATTGGIIALDSIMSNDFSTGASAITSDKNGNYYLGGSFGSQLYPAQDTISKVGGNLDWFIAKYGSANCNCTIPQPSFTYVVSGSNTLGFTYTGSTPYTGISWDFGDGSAASSMSNPQHSYTSSGSYNVCVTVTNDCGSNTYCQNVSTTGTGINNITGFADINIYPNPATQDIMIERAGTGTILDIYSATGSLILHAVLQGSKDRINVDKLASGIYLMRFTDAKGKQGSTRFVKQ